MTILGVAEVTEPTDIFCNCTLLFKLLQCLFSCFAVEVTKPIKNLNFKAFLMIMRKIEKNASI